MFMYKKDFTGETAVRGPLHLSILTPSFNKLMGVPVGAIQNDTILTLAEGIPRCRMRATRRDVSIYIYIYTHLRYICYIHFYQIITWIINYA